MSEAPPIGSLEVSATVRQAVALQVQISNPLHDALTFDLTYGSDQLVGPDVLALKPKESREFEFFFAPLVEGISQALITFSSFRVSLLFLCSSNLSCAFPSPCTSPSPSPLPPGVLNMHEGQVMDHALASSIRHDNVIIYT